MIDSQSNILIEIEQFVQLISKGFTQDQYPQIHSQLCDRISTYLSVYQHNYDYSEYVEAFWFGCNQVALFMSGRFGNDDQVSRMINHIHHYTQLPYFKRRVFDRRYQVKENAKSIGQYANALHKRYSRLLVVRVDFGYREDNAHLVSIDTHLQSFDKLKQQYYTNPIFKHLVGHAWCIEQGQTKGYHIHAVYYFKGSEHQNDWYMAKQIGELWQRVTNGLGTYHSCNTPQEKQKYQKLDTLGVGMIHRNDDVACENAINAVGYLADYEKEDQYLRMKPKGRRTFGTGVNLSLIHI